jgi:hypothetical protein
VCCCMRRQARCACVWRVPGCIQLRVLVRAPRTHSRQDGSLQAHPLGRVSSKAHRRCGHGARCFLRHAKLRPGAGTSVPSAQRGACCSI